MRRHRWLWLGLLNAFVFLMLVVAPFEVIGPVVAKRDLGGAFEWGVILTGFSVGMLLGGLFMLRVRLERPLFVAGLLFFATCVAPLLLALPAPAWCIALAYVGEGFAVGIFVTAWETALQSHIPPRDAGARRGLGLARHDRRHAAWLRAHRPHRGRRRHTDRRWSASAGAAFLLVAHVRAQPRPA